MNWVDVVHCASIGEDPGFFYDLPISFEELLTNP